MATAWVTEFSFDGGSAQLAEEPAIRTQVVTFTSSTQVALFFSENTRTVRISASAACHIAFGEDPTATVNDEHLHAGQEAWRRLGRRRGLKVAIVAAA